MNKYTINYNKLNSTSYTFTTSPFNSWGTIAVSFPLAQYESIDEKVSAMETFPEVQDILRKISK